MSRHDARVLALQALFEADTVGHPVGEVLNRHFAEAEWPAAVRDYAVELVSGVVANQEALDRCIGELAPEFPAKFLAPIDRNILRIALFELQSGAVPLKVAINEAVNMAKEFGSETSARFVNGVLGTAAARI